MSRSSFGILEQFLAKELEGEEKRTTTVTNNDGLTSLTPFTNIFKTLCLVLAEEHDRESNNQQ
jgi:hypothetical protein